MKPPLFKKQPWEERKLEFDVSNSLAPGDSVRSVDSVNVLLNGAVQAAMCSSGTLVGSKVYARVKGGTHGVDYYVRVRVNTVNGDKIEDDLLLQVREIST